jgi:hypothetical protein
VQAQARDAGAGAAAAPNCINKDKGAKQEPLRRAQRAGTAGSRSVVAGSR